MSRHNKHPRVIGTTDEAVVRAEEELSRRFPPSFRDWLLANNGLNLDGVHVFPVLDDRDPRKTWDSIVRNFQNGWAAWLENFHDEPLSFDHLLPFANYGTGDYYCFDYNAQQPTGECAVVRWSHETGECEARASTFTEFGQRLRQGAFAND